jgi:3-isopropylmalate/(R)-2-methylmalate dehydratase large subunit
MAQTLYDKLWSSHVVHTEDDGTALLYIDRHLVHEVTSPQAFEGLRLANRKPWRVDSIVATADHNVPTDRSEQGIADPISRAQVETLDDNIRAFGALAYFPFRDKRQGIVHVIGPENGATLPGMTVVCGDSHTSTHGAFGCLAHGIGTSEVEHVMATQCLLQKKSKSMLIRVEGELGKGVSAKDIALYFIGVIGTAGGTGYAIEFGGSAIRGLSMEGRMTLCNMAIEGGARAGMVAVDDKTIDYLQAAGRSRPRAEQWDRAVAYWRTLKSDEGAQFDRRGRYRRAQDPAAGDLGHFARNGDRRARPGAGRPRISPIRSSARAWPVRCSTWTCHAAYADQPRSASTRCSSAPVPIRASRICAPPRVVEGRRVADNVKLALVVPGSGLVKAQAERKGWTRCSRRPVSNGASRAVRCAWR